MAIPIIDEILQFISNMFQVMPKSVKYILYLVFLFGLLSLIPFMLHMMGIHCDSQKNIRQTSPVDVYGNYEISKLSKKDLYNVSNFKPVVDAQFLVFGSTELCSHLIKFDHSGFWGDFYSLCDKNDTLANNTGCSYALRIGNKKGLFSSEPACYTCQDQRNVAFISTNSLLNDDYCFSNAYPNNESGCPDLELCDIPYGYYFNNQTGNFICNDNNICGANKTVSIYDIDIELNKMGATRLYGNNQNEDDYNNVVKFKCYGKSLAPQLTIIGVPIFDYKLWLLITILGAMFFFYVKYR